MRIRNATVNPAGAAAAAADAATRATAPLPVPKTRTYITLVHPPSRSGPLGLPEEFSRFSLSNVVLVVAIAQAVTRFGFILRINAHGLERRYRRRRVRDEDTAAALFAAAVQAIESGGIAELREWAGR